MSQCESVGLACSPPAADAGTTALVAWLVSHVDECDPVNRGHSWRVSRLVEEAAAAFGMVGADRRRLVEAALLHDVGKISVPHHLLRRPGRLETAEFAQIQRHSELGARILFHIPALAHAAPVARWHHERWDGRGYPDGLSGTQVPFAARLVGVCDAFDAMTSRRAESAPAPLSTAIAELRAHAGTQFDPTLVHLVCSLDLRAILREFERNEASGLCNDTIAA